MGCTVFVHGRFLVHDQHSPTCPEFKGCIVVEEGKITHLGHESDDVPQVARQNGAEVVDLEHRMVIPGFIDGHTHLMFLGLSLTKLDLSGCKSLTQIRTAISDYAKTNPNLPRLLCRGWHQPSTDGLALASMLDDLDPRSIFIESLDLHSTWCNTAALSELPIEEIKQVCGHHISCDEDGNPTGLLAENAQTGYIWPHLVRSCAAADKQSALELAFQSLVEAGYTGAIDMAMDDDAWEALADLRRTKGLPLHIAAHWFIPFESSTDKLMQHVDQAIERHHTWHPEVSRDFCVVGIKLVSDGVVDGCTAALSRPYPGQKDMVMPIWPAESIDLVVKRAAAAGLQVAVHAIGDRAITQAINSIAQVGDSRARHRIEHLELPTEEDVQRLGQLGITASIQPVHSDPDMVRKYESLIGPELWKRAFPYREFADVKTCLAIGTDAPTARHLPLPNLYNATTRRSATDPSLKTQTQPHNALSLDQAIIAATRGAAYSRFAENWVGSLEKGKQADFVVLDVEWTADTLLSGKVVQTWSRGRKLYDAESGTV